MSKHLGLDSVGAVCLYPAKQLLGSLAGVGLSQQALLMHLQVGCVYVPGQISVLHTDPPHGKAHSTAPRIQEREK